MASVSSSRVLLRAQPGDTDGIEVRSEILKVASPVLDGILGDSSATAESEDGADLPILTLGCTADELVAFVTCISMPAGKNHDHSQIHVAMSMYLMEQGAIAMRCLSKYDAKGILLMFDLMSEHLAASSLASRIDCVYAQELADYLYARLATLPDDTLPDAVSEAVYSFLVSRMTAELAPARQLSKYKRWQQPVLCCRAMCWGASAATQPQIDAEAALRASVEAVTLGTLPPKVRVEILVRVIIFG
jgi:hypothetical protein